MEYYPTASRFQSLHHDGCTRQSGVATERDLGSWREPANLIVLALANKKGRLREVVLGRDGL